MSDALPGYVQENHAEASAVDLSSWVRENPLPAICEPKYEGQRVFLFKSGEHLVVSGKVGSVYTPASNPVVFSKVPELVQAPQKMILDGEYVSREGLHIFDVLQTDDRDMRPLPLYRRKEILHQLIAESGLETPFIWAETQQQIQRFAVERISEGGQGIIVKNPNSFYGQRDSWVKVKRSDTVDCFVIDYHDEAFGNKKVWSLALYDPAGKIVTLGDVNSYAERVDPQKVRLGSVVEVRYSLVADKFCAQFILRVRRDKFPSECTVSQISQQRKELLS